MGIRWQCIFPSYDRTENFANTYTVDIIDIDMDIDPKNEFNISTISIRGAADENDVIQRIVSTKCNLVISVDNNSIEHFIEELGSNDEEKFWLRIKRNASTVFIGAISTEGAYIQDRDFPYTFSCKATDEISRLKNKKYDGTLTAQTYGISLLNHIQGIFDLTRLSEFYGTGEAFIEFYGGWYSADSNSDNNAFHESGLLRNAFDKLNGDKLQKTNAVDALKGILLYHNARIVWNYGTYAIESLPYRADNDPLTRHRYDKDFTLISKDTNVTYLNKNYDHDTIRRASGGQQTFLPPIKFTEINYKHDPVDDYAIRQDNYTIGQVEQGRILVVNPDQKIRIECEFNINNLQWDQSSPGRKRPVIRMTIKVGSKYLKKVQTGGTISNPVFSAMTWEDNLSFFEYLPLLQDRQKTKPESYGFTTEELVPTFTQNAYYDVEAAFISLEYLDQSMQRQTVLGTYTLSEAKLFLYPTESQTSVNEKTETIFRALNSNNNSTVIEIKTAFGEGPEDSSASGIRALDGFYKPNKENWGPDSENLMDLVAGSITAMREKPIRQLTGWPLYYKSFFPSLVMDWESRRWLFSEYNHTLRTELITGELLQIKYDKSGVTKEKEKFITLGEPYTPAGGGPYTDPGTPAGNIDVYQTVLPDDQYKEYPDVSTTTVILPSGWDLPDETTATDEEINQVLVCEISGTIRKYNRSRGYKYVKATRIATFLGPDGVTPVALRSEFVSFRLKDADDSKYKDYLSVNASTIVLPVGWDIPDDSTSSAEEINKRLICEISGTIRKYNVSLGFKYVKATRVVTFLGRDGVTPLTLRNEDVAFTLKPE